MIQDQVAADLFKLEETLRQIKALLAWEQLKQSERKSGWPPGFQVGDSTSQELRDQYSSFLTTSLGLHCLLNNADGKSLSPRKKPVFLQKLTKMESEFRKLNLSERFIKV